MTRIAIYDTTLRDGSQGEGVNFSLQDKLLITAQLDAVGFDYIEGGYPLSNPKDAAYFRAVRDLDLKHARVAAFGMTRRRDVAAEDDVGMRALVGAATPVVTIVGKSWDFQAREVLGVSLEENLRMIADSLAFCAAHVAEVLYDAEHFFDGYKRNPDYALRTVQAAAEAGAACVVLCDTNGGSLPEEVARTNAESYEHIEPAAVGNERRVLVSELSGKSNIAEKLGEYGLEQDSELLSRVLDRVQDLENEGYQFEAAEASFVLLVERLAGRE